VSFTDALTLGEARDLLRTLVDEGHDCPLCTQFAKVYRRPIHATMALELIAFYRYAGREWGALKQSGVQRGGDMVKCRYWGLIEAMDGERDDGSERVGWWRVTELGEAWIHQRARVKKYARVYDGRCLGLHGEEVSIVDALGKKFNYAELMGGLWLVRSTA
jgi:hypothetical protein